MKKLQKIALLGVIALAGSVSFTSCSSDDDAAIGPDGERLAVKTEFALNIPTNSKAITRMSDANAQVNDGTASRTLKQLTLVPFGNKFDDGATVPAKFGTEFVADISTASKIAETYNNQANHYLFSDVQVPIGTKAFLGYLTTTGTGDDNAQGALVDANGNALDFTDPGTLNVNLKSIEVEDDPGVVAALNAIASAEGWATTDNAGLYDLYYRFTQLTSGSSAKAKALVDDLTKALENNDDAISTAIKNAITTNAIPENFPKNAPQGAIAIAWDGEKFVAANDKELIGINATSRDAYVNPAALVYRVNSTVATATESQADNYVYSKSWEEILSPYTPNSSVQANTVSTALEDDMDYAVGRLAAEVSLTDDSFKSLTTNYVYVWNEDTEELEIDEQQTTEVEETISIADGFLLNGIIIGGQNPVKWDFTPASADKNWALYDKNIQTPTIKKGTDAKNSTLVLETEKDAVVKVAIELKNNTGKDIKIGDGRVIKKDAIFYLVGELDPATVTDSKLPEDKAGKVFVQDYVTTVKFAISPEGLKNATDVIPDLTRPELELGLSVNLEWHDADTYVINLDGPTPSTETPTTETGE